MIDRYLKLFHLSPDATLADVKKAYRALAKQNHPDRFTDDTLKKKQEKIMLLLNEAYRKIETELKNKTSAELPNEEKRKTGKENDTELYKEGVALFNRYSGSMSIKNPQYTKFDRESIDEKRAHLKNAQSSFFRLLEEYPDSDWAYDASERLKKIEAILKHLTAEEDASKTQPLPRKDSAFYADKFEKMFRS